MLQRIPLPSSFIRRRQDDCERIQFHSLAVTSQMHTFFCEKLMQNIHANKQHSKSTSRILNSVVIASFSIVFRPISKQHPIRFYDDGAGSRILFILPNDTTISHITVTLVFFP